jgi:hypothetical protein
MERIKVLKVVEYPQGNSYVPGIRIAGKWLSVFGFNYGDSVRLRARKNAIVIRKINSDKEGLS